MSPHAARRYLAWQGPCSDSALSTIVIYRPSNRIDRSKAYRLDSPILRLCLWDQIQW